MTRVAMAISPTGRTGLDAPAARIVVATSTTIVAVTGAGRVASGAVRNGARSAISTVAAAAVVSATDSGATPAAVRAGGRIGAIVVIDAGRTGATTVARDTAGGGEAVAR